MKFTLLALASLFLGSAVAQQNMGMPGGYFGAGDYTKDGNFIKADQLLRYNHPELAGASVVSVLTQVVAGTNYKITYQLGNTFYEAVVFIQGWTSTIRETSFDILGQQSSSTGDSSSGGASSSGGDDESYFITGQATDGSISDYYYPPSNPQPFPTSVTVPAPVVVATPISDPSPAPVKLPTTGTVAGIPKGFAPSGLPETPDNPLCKAWASNTQCKECSFRAYFKQNSNLCVAVSDDCKDYNRQSGDCTLCYNGYAVQNGKCVTSSVQIDIGGGKTTKVSALVAGNPLCVSWVGNTCQQCSFRSTFDQNNRCVKVSDDCKEYDAKTGQCNNCYNGFNIVNGSCIDSRVLQDIGGGRSAFVPALVASNPLCGKWEGTVCTGCSYRSYFGQGRLCVKVDENCKDFNQNTGACFNCYPGWRLTTSGCVAPVQTDPVPKAVAPQVISTIYQNSGVPTQQWGPRN